MKNYLPALALTIILSLPLTSIQAQEALTDEETFFEEALTEDTENTETDENTSEESTNTQSSETAEEETSEESLAENEETTSTQVSESDDEDAYSLKDLIEDQKSLYKIPGATSYRGATLIAHQSRKQIGKYLLCDTEDAPINARFASFKISQGAPTDCREDLLFRYLPYRSFRK